MTYAVRVPEVYYCIVNTYISEGQSVAPGAHLFDIMTPNGVVEKVLSEGWGIVAHAEGGKLLEPDNDNFSFSSDIAVGADFMSGAKTGIYNPTHVICHIVPRSDRSQAGAGLRPRPSASLRMRRENAIAPR